MASHYLLANSVSRQAERPVSASRPMLVHEVPVLATRVAPPVDPCAPAPETFPRVASSAIASWSFAGSPDPPLGMVGRVVTFADLQA